MRYRNKVIFLVIVVLVVVFLQLSLPRHPGMLAFYSSAIFRPYQSLRNIIFGSLPVSVGDILYVVVFFWITVTIVKWLYFLVKFKTHKHALGHSVIRSFSSLGIAYILFFVGWGGNYYKPSLSKFWQLSHTQNDAELFLYDSAIIQRLNALAPFYHGLSFQESDNRAQKYYKLYTDSKTRMHGLNAKSSIFGNMMEYFRIQGYYNPFTGEAQVNRYLPAFMLPFVVSHELAHQSGIAAEDDANLLAYAVGSASRDTEFLYSANFNIWLYTQWRVQMADSAKAKELKKQLNPLTMAHLDTLRAMRKKYLSDVSDYSAALYDGYLRLHNQKDGIHSYNNVALSAWAWDKQRVVYPTDTIKVP